MSPTKEPACCYCRRTLTEMHYEGETLRQYGPAGAWACFACSFATAERGKTAEQQAKKQFDAAVAKGAGYVTTDQDLGFIPATSPGGGAATVVLRKEKNTATGSSKRLI